MTAAQANNVTPIQSLNKADIKKIPRVVALTNGLPNKIMASVNGLTMRETPLESINSKVLCHELITKSGFTIKDYAKDELRYVEERVSSYASGFFKQGKLRRTTKRINGGMFGYFVHQTIRPSETMDDRIQKADKVEQEQYKKLTSLKTIKELLHNLKAHELSQVMQVTGELLDTKCRTLDKDNEDLLSSLVAAEDKNKAFADKLRPLLEVLEQ